MPVVKVLVVQIQSDTIISYSEQVRHKGNLHFSPFSGTNFNFGLQTVVYLSNYFYL